MEYVSLKGSLGMYIVLPQALHGALFVTYRHIFLLFSFFFFFFFVIVFNGSEIGSGPSSYCILTDKECMAE